MSTLFVIAAIICLWLKMKIHWRYYVIINQLPSTLSIGKYMNEQMVEENSFLSSFSVYLKFFTPFFGTEILDESTNESRVLRRKIHLRILLFWLFFAAFFFVELVIYR
jgi:hypothetical protein